MEESQVTSELLWRATLYAIILDAPLLLLITKYVSYELLLKLKWYILGITLLIFGGIWGIFGSLLFWDSVYKYIFPEWFHWYLPIIYGPIYGLLSFIFWRISIFIKRYSVILFILLGGLFSIVGHSIGISRGLFNVPLLSKASIESALIFGIFEFIFYWCIILILSISIRWIVKKVILKEEDRTA
jgi:hypothetical protein